MLHGVRRHHHHHRGLDLAGVMHGFLILQELLEVGLRTARNRSWRRASAPVSRVRSGRNALSAAILPPWPLTMNTRLKPCRSMLLRNAEQHRLIGRNIERERAAERHVVLGHAAPQRRRDHARRRLHGELGAGLAHRFAQERIDADREMRPVLLHRGDGQHHDRIRRALARRSSAVSSFHITDGISTSPSSRHSGTGSRSARSR